MKIEITQKGTFDAKGKPIEVGTELTVKGKDVPAQYLNKCRVLKPVKPSKAAVTNPVNGGGAQTKAD